MHTRTIRTLHTRTLTLRTRTGWCLYAPDLGRVYPGRRNATGLDLAVDGAPVCLPFDAKGGGYGYRNGGSEYVAAIDAIVEAYGLDRVRFDRNVAMGW